MGILQHLWRSVASSSLAKVKESRQKDNVSIVTEDSISIHIHVHPFKI
jgi:hypothetical protein